MDTTAGATTAGAKTARATTASNETMSIVENCVRDHDQLWNCSATTTIREKDLAGENVTFSCKFTYKGQELFRTVTIQAPTLTKPSQTGKY